MIISCNTTFAIRRKRERSKKTWLKNERREPFQIELSGLIEKQNNLISTCDSLKDEFTRYVTEAEKQADLTPVTKANALKGKQTEQC